MKKQILNKNDVALAVGIYDTVVGLWPLLSMGTFKEVTELSHPLIARFLGASWATLGIALLLSSNNRKLIPPLGVASTVAGSTLATTQLLLIAGKKISPIFLVQAFCETVIGCAWLATLTTDVDDNLSDALEEEFMDVAHPGT